MIRLKIHRAEFISAEGISVKMIYNESDDMPDIFFGENEPASGIDLTDHILLRINRKTGKAVSLTIRRFSVLTEQTEYGPRSYPLGSFDELPDELREPVIRAITSSPVNQFLKVTYFQASPTENIPFTYVDPYRLQSVA